VLGSATIYKGSKIFLDKLVATGLAVDDASIALQTKGLAAHADLRGVWDEYVTTMKPYVDLWRGGRCSDVVTVAAPKEVIVLGGFAPVPGVEEAFARAFNLPTRTSLVWERLCPVDVYPPGIHAKESFRFTSAAGLLLANS
jgi:hypothetical protein